MGQEGNVMHRLLVEQHFPNERSEFFSFNIQEKRKKNQETTDFKCKETNDYPKSEKNDRLNRPNETPN